MPGQEFKRSTVKVTKGQNRSCLLACAVIFAFCAMFSVSKRLVLNPGVDANVYAEIRKSTMEPPTHNTGRPAQNDVQGNGAVATGATAYGQLTPGKAEGVHGDSLQDLTLIDNSIYRDAAECTKPAARNSDRYLPGGRAFFIMSLYRYSFAAPVASCVKIYTVSRKKTS